MRIGIVVDSPCDLPQSNLRKHNITILPTTVRAGGDSMADFRDPIATALFLRTHDAALADAESSPFSVQEIRELFLSRLVIDYDYVFCMTITKTRSGIFDNAQQASFAILNEYKAIRAKAGHDTPFALRVVDTQNLFAAQGITAVEAVRLRDAGEGTAKIRARLEHLALHTQGFLVPRDLNYLRARTRKRGDRSVSFLSATLGTALDIKPILHCNRGDTGPVAKVRGFEQAAQKLFAHVANRVRGGLMTPTVCLSYGGELDEMRALPGYDDLRVTCGSYNIELFESVMSLTSTVNIGKGGLAAGYAAESQPFEG